MLILVSISILFLAALASLVLVRLNLSQGYMWFLAVGGSLIAWVLVMISYPKEPLLINLQDWTVSALFVDSPRLLLDLNSWPFAMGITTLLIAVLVTDVAQVQEIQPIAWVADLGMAGSGLLAVLAANPLTLMIAWVFIDLAETYTLLSQISGSQQRERVVVSFSVRAVGVLLVISALLRAQVLGVALTFTNIPPEVSGYLILAAGLRLGVLPPYQAFLQEPPLRRGLGTMTRLIPVAASLVLLTRVASVGVTSTWEMPLLFTAILAVIYGSLTWSWASDELDGRPYWILGLSAFSVVAAIEGQFSASLSWGVALIFSGGLLFLYSTRRRSLIWLPALGLVGLSALPFTPAWPGAQLFSGWNLIFSIIFILALSFLILGYAKHMIRSQEATDEIERWVWLIYPLGLLILPITHFWVTWSLGGFSLPDGGIKSAVWWVGIAALGSAGTLMVLLKRLDTSATNLVDVFRKTISFGWMYRMFWWFYRSMGRLFAYLARLLEGEGGIFWAVLFLILLVTIILQNNGGG